GPPQPFAILVVLDPAREGAVGPVVPPVVVAVGLPRPVVVQRPLAAIDVQHHIAGAAAALPVMAFAAAAVEAAAREWRSGGGPGRSAGKSAGPTIHRLGRCGGGDDCSEGQGAAKQHRLHVAVPSI